MLAHDGSTRKHSPSGNNNQQGGTDASQTSDSVANNRSLPTGCCCRPAGSPVSVAPIEPSCHAITCQSCEIVSDGNAPPAHCTVHGKLWSCTSGYQKAEHSSSTKVDMKFAPLSLSNLAGAPKIIMKYS